MVDPALNSSSSDQDVLQPILNGMSHTAIISNSIYIWGNMILYRFVRKHIYASKDANTMLMILQKQ